VVSVSKRLTSNGFGGLDVVKRSAALSVGMIGVVAAVVTIVAPHLNSHLKIVIVVGIAAVSVSFAVGYEAGKGQRAPVLEDIVARTYPRSQHHEFFSDVDQLARTASNITLIATGLNLLWEKNILDLLIERAQMGKAKVTVCMGNTRSPHVLGRLIEEEMKENRPPTGRAFIQRNVETLVERLALAGNPAAFKVLLFEHYPTFAMLMFDDKIFVYPYAYQVLGNTSPIFQIRDTGSAEAEFFKAHAERVLNDAVSASDLVNARQTPRFYSAAWKNAAVFAIPEEGTELYKAGTAILGYDIWRQCDVAIPSGCPDLRKHVGAAADFGFHITLADALYFSNDAEIDRVQAELRMLAEEFAPVWLTAFDLSDLQDPDILVLRVRDESGTLEAIHHELVARVYSMAISSTYKAGKTRKRFPLGDARARLMVNRYGSPYIIKEFSPHFTLCSAMPAVEAERADVERQADAYIGPGSTDACEIAELVLVERGNDEQRWHVLNRFRLRG
jgi:hypothetical protein